MYLLLPSPFLPRCRHYMTDAAMAKLLTGWDGFFGLRGLRARGNCKRPKHLHVSRNPFVQLRALQQKGGAGETIDLGTPSPPHELQGFGHIT